MPVQWPLPDHWSGRVIMICRSYHPHAVAPASLSATPASCSLASVAQPQRLGRKPLIGPQHCRNAAHEATPGDGRAWHEGVRCRSSAQTCGLRPLAQRLYLAALASARLHLRRRACSPSGSSRSPRLLRTTGGTADWPVIRRDYGSSTRAVVLSRLLFPLAGIGNEAAVPSRRVRARCQRALLSPETAAALSRRRRRRLYWHSCTRGRPR